MLARITLIGIALCAIPMSASAAIIINEIAWMGSITSANDEWIELYNTGNTDVLLDGWTLSDGVNLTIALSGTISAGAYAVLERTDDTTAPGVAFFIYTGALSNTGATLTLTRSDGDIEDQVAGGENWENIGGDNTTKETAQYTSSGWITGEGTPGSSNTTYQEETEVPEGNDGVEEESENTSTPGSINTAAQSTPSVPLVLPDVTLTLHPKMPEYAYVNQPVLFSVEGSGIGDRLLDSLTFSWNFGDLSTASGKEVEHVYTHPGTYVVIVEGSYARHSAIGRHVITVLPVTLSLSRRPNGDLLIHNNAHYEVDISGYLVRGNQSITIPEHTVLLPNATIGVPQEKVGAAVVAALYDQEDKLIASLFPENNTETVAEEKTIHTTAVTAPIVSTPKPTSDLFNFANEDNSKKLVSQTEREAEESPIPTRHTASVIESNIPISNERLPYLGLIGVMIVGLLAIYAGKNK